MTNLRSKTPSAPDTALPSQDEPEEPSDELVFQFGSENDEAVSQTWIRRAVDVGMRLTRTISEVSGLKILPELDLYESARGGKPRQPSQSRPDVPAARLGAAMPKLPVEPVAIAEDMPSYHPPDKSAFGRSENSFGKTAINSFVVTEEAKPKPPAPTPSRSVNGVQIRTRPLYHMPAIGRPRETPVSLRIAKSLAILLLVAGLGFGTWRVLEKSQLGAAMLRLKASLGAASVKTTRDKPERSSDKKERKAVKGN